jgi:hypothetical protein
MMQRLDCWGIRPAKFGRKQIHQTAQLHTTTKTRCSHDDALTINARDNAMAINKS